MPGAEGEGRGDRGFVDADRESIQVCKLLVVEIDQKISKIQTGQGLVYLLFIHSRGWMYFSEGYGLNSPLHVTRRLYFKFYLYQ